MTPAPESPDAALVERLRGGVFGLNRIALCQEAATTITRLTAERDAALRDAERLRVALHRLLVRAERVNNFGLLTPILDARAALSAQERSNV